jgi:hypothetical protein
MLARIRSVGLTFTFLVTAVMAQEAPPKLSPDDARTFLSELLADELQMPGNQVRIDNNTVFVALNLAGSTPEDFTASLVLIFMAAATAAEWSENVRIIFYQGIVPLFVVSTPTQEIMDFAEAMIDEEEFAQAWQFEGIE